jgi:chromosome segregation protein
MRLNTLEIKGFKSFGDKVTIHFDKGVTSIVGPNGSGKSNVVDAMRWVLGEQKTRMLRSEKMENIIFNGTKTRKPANLAEVSLTFENTKNILPTEFSTVCITRKLYRTGESEYMLNGVTCRLKDITDLFLDTGIGSDSYAIIELKMIDEILNDRNNTIKFLLEEAAGISKYKIRKKQTFQKLEETDADLNRVTDLVFEIEKSLKQLEAQAKKAEKYYRLKDEYKQVSTALAVFTLQSFKKTLEELQSKEQLQQDEKIQLSVKIDSLEAGIQQYKTDVLDKEKQLTETQKLFNAKVLQLNQTENEEKNRQEKLKYVIEKQQQLNRQNFDADVAIAEYQEQIGKLGADKTVEEARLTEIEAEVTALKAEVEKIKIEYSQSQQELRELNNQLFNARQELNNHETQMAVRKTRFNSILEEMKRINDLLLQNEGKLSQIENELTLQQPVKESLEKSLESVKSAYMEADKELKSAEESLNDSHSRLREVSRLLDAKTNEFQLTKNMLDQLDGYPESIKFLRKNHTGTKKAPLLSDIINCDDAYKIPIETFLEPFLSYFIADDPAHAWEAIDLLNESAKGRANFFVLDTLANFHLPVYENINGCTGALDVIDVDARYKKLFELLLGHVYIMEDAGNVQSLDMNEKSSLVVLSKNGAFLKQKYNVGGGSIGLFDGKRTGKLKNLEKLQDQIDRHQQEVDEIKSSIRSRESLVNELKNKIRHWQEDQGKTESELSKIKISLQSLQNNREFIFNGSQSYKSNIVKLEAEMNNISSRQTEAIDKPEELTERLSSKLATVTEALKNKQEYSSDLQMKLNEISQTYNQQNILFLQQQNKIQNITREHGYKTTQLENIHKTKSQNEEDLVSLAAQHDKINSELQEKRDELIVMHEERKAQEELLQQHEADYYKAKGSIEEEDKLINDIRRKKEQADMLIQAIHDEINNLKLELTSLKERLHIEFNIDINEIISQEPDAQLSEEEVRSRSEYLKRKIDDFGPINPMALESFKEIKERYDFIIKEQEDLKKAKESLLQTIAEIDATAKEKFMDAYFAVRNNFIKVFRSLFSEEDKCDLILTDLNNPLESDINIIAQPKGKKPLSIHQLSGGEKTLTATALLFGIYLLKPAPFCIFDEVDAPLDDNNIDKFNNIIKTFSGESQFIIITHNKKTMAATDIIYGITMAEPGVTTVVPVDLRAYA